MQIYCALSNLFTFPAVYPSDLLPHSVISSCNSIINPQEFNSRFATTTTNPDRQIKHLFPSEFGTLFTVRDEPLFVISMYLFVAYSFLLYLPHGVEVVVDYAALKGAHEEIMIKGFAIASNGIIPAYHFRARYAMVQNVRENNASNDHDITVDDRHISYSQLSTVLHEAPAG